MAFNFTVTELRDSGGLSFQGTDDKMKIQWSRKFRVDVTATGGDVAEDVSEYDVLTASGIPIVNRSVFYRNGQIIPFVICRGKDAKPMKDNRARWIVTATYRSEDANQDESSNQPQDPPAALTDITPSEEPSLGQFEKVLYVDKNGTDIRLPSGNMYTQPVVEMVPTLQIRITQYESSITYEQMLERKYKVNSSTYRTKGAGQWLISEVEATEVDVVLSGGTVSAALVTYTLDLSPHEYYDRNTSQFVTAGWDVPMMLVDNLHLEGSKWKPAMIDERGRVQFFVDDTGAKIGNGISGNPDYEVYRVQDSIDFSTFLQV